MLGIFSCFYAVFCFCFCFFSLFFQNQFFRKNLFISGIRVSKKFNPDQGRHFVGPDLSPNCLPRLSADDIVAVKKFGRRLRFRENTKVQKLRKKRFIGF